MGGTVLLLLLLVSGGHSVLAQSGTSSGPALVSIAVTPAGASILPDRDIQFTATGAYSDGSTDDLTSSVTWSSSVPAAATINRVGAATARAVGQTTIEAVLGAINGSTTLNVVLAGSFVLTGSLNAPRAYFTATLLNNGMVLMAGGYNFFAEAPISSAELYNPATGTFSYSTGSLNAGRWDHTATLLNNGMVLLAGGCCDDNGVLASAELYNPATGTFTPTGSMNTGRWGPTATLLNNGMVLMTGGQDSSANPLGSAELYNPAAGTFSYTGSPNTPRTRGTATLLNDGMVLIAGGQAITNGAPLASAELYNPATGTFSYATGSMNPPFYSQTATLLNNGMVLMAGGQNWGGTLAAVEQAEVYDPATETFFLTGSTNTWRLYPASKLLNNGMVLMAGGAFDGAPTAELYNPATGTFTYTTGSMNDGRVNHTATLLNNGMVLIAGGDLQSSAELYEPVLCPPPNLESIAITPATSTLSPGATQRFIAMGKFSDGTTQQLASVTWSSSNRAVAQISNDASNPGVGLAVAAGKVMIEAGAAWVRGWASLTVK